MAASSFVTLSAYDYFGESIVAGYDFNGDGVLDLAVGAFGDDDGEDDDAGREGTATAVHVLFMTADHTVSGAAKVSNEEGTWATPSTTASAAPSHRSAISMATASPTLPSDRAQQQQRQCTSCS